MPNKTQRRGYADLKAWRDDMELSQAEAAEMLGLSQKSYSRFERGQRFARGPIAKRLVKRTGVPLEVLVGAV
jgi:transcriptional regulator with XRE-family HTH domain